MIPVNKINAVKRFADRELRESVSKHGVQVPIFVEELKNGRYRLLDGACRLNATVNTMIPANVFRVTHPVYRNTFSKDLASGRYRGGKFQVEIKGVWVTSDRNEWETNSSF